MIANARFTSSQCIVLAVVISLCYVRSDAQAASTGACEITDQSCPCSQSIPSGSCMKNQGDGSCLLGYCQASYRCDCLGYQMCTKSKCSVYTAADATIPSETIPFACHLPPDAGSCITFHHMIDTVEAALNAKVEASNSNNEALLHSVDAQNLVTELHAEDLLVNEELLTIDSIRHQLAPEEEHTILSNARVIKDSVTQSARDALNISLEAGEAYDWNLKTAEHAHSAIQAEKDAKNAEYQLEEHNSKAQKENRTCPVCKQLEQDIEKLTQLRKQDAVTAGNSAKKCTNKRDIAALVLNDIHESRVRCGVARAKVLSAIAKLKTRLGLS